MSGHHRGYLTRWKYADYERNSKRGQFRFNHFTSIFVLLPLQRQCLMVGAEVVQASSNSLIKSEELTPITKETGRIEGVQEVMLRCSTVSICPVITGTASTQEGRER